MLYDKINGDDTLLNKSIVDLVKAIEIRNEDPREMIPALKNKKDLLETIYISSNATSLLHSKNKLDKESDFSEYLKKFNEIIIEIKYPSDEFENIYNSVMKLRDQFKNNRPIMISILITEIPNVKNIFSKNNNVNYIKIDSSVQSIPFHYFFKCHELIDVSISNSVSTIERGAFCECSKLKFLSLPDSLEEIEEEFLSSCTSLTKIEIPKNVREIGNSAFYGCSSLQVVRLPECLTTIGEYAFNGCSSLKEIVLPRNITTIKSMSFLECNNLKTVKYPQCFKLFKKNIFHENICFESYKI
ncbi:hypothetical protein M9Y10_035516 [Tritrichomonas musculus]|uniref:Uncharacterized protein n=1 Tax=Tritrichomonas musculus TaxID=1915356 RepID=A0ABR2KIR1_9EUKA